MRQLTLNFDGYASGTGAAARAVAARDERTEIQRVAAKSGHTLAEAFACAAASAMAVMPALLLPAGFVLATGADTIPQALASLACFALGAWPLGVFDMKRKGGAR